MGDFNREELLYGAAFGISMVWWTHWLAIPVTIFSAPFWALGGAPGESAAWRRIGCPLVQITALILSTQSWLPVILFPVAFSLLSIGYGVPSTQPPDEGSDLGRFFWKITGGEQPLTDLLTRGTIMTLLIGIFAWVAHFASL